MSSDLVDLPQQAAPIDAPEVVRVHGLGKCYHMYKKPGDRLKQTLFRGRRQYYREFWALRDVSFSIRKGETVGVIGRNGSGKSTLLQLICGTLAPTVGSVETHGRIAALLELGAGFHPEFTGRENIFLNARILGLTREETEARFDKIAAFADIGQFLERPVKTYSSGMYVRLAFSVIANVNADLLIIDEALAVGDVFFTQKCMRFLRAFRERGTVFFVSHSPQAVISLCQRAIWLEKGQLHDIGPAKEVTESYHREFRETMQGGSSLAEESVSGVGMLDPAADDHELPLSSFQVKEPDRSTIPEAGQAGFGARGMTIDNVALLNAHGTQVDFANGGEVVTLRIYATAHAPIDRPIVGFYVKDRLGQRIFGDNTAARYAENPLHLPAGRKFTSSFTFRLPLLATGPYSICVALSAGTQEDHIVHHWIDDTRVFNIARAQGVTGLVGIPMMALDITPAADVSTSPSAQ